MVRVLLGLMVCVLVAGDDRYSDYSGARMPVYNMEDGSREAAPLTDEYIDRSPDVPAPYDYKYEEELHDKTDNLQNKVNDYKQHKKLRDSQSPINNDELEKHEIAIVPKLKASRRSRKHRSRIKYKEPDRKSSRRVAKYGRSQKFDKNYVEYRNNHYFNKVPPREDNNLDYDNYDDIDTTEKIIRRKPRDRTTNNSDNDETKEDENGVKLSQRDDGSENIDKDRSRFVVAQRPRPVPDLPKMKPHTNYPDYNYYYDMKRVNNIKSKLPGLLRKTQATTTSAASVAERELKALLGHRQRKDVPYTPQASSSSIPSTFPPNAVDSRIDDEWIQFLGSNSERKLQHSMFLITYVTVLSLLNTVKYYR